MASTIDQVDLYIKHVVEIHSEEIAELNSECNDSGNESVDKLSLDSTSLPRWDPLPGANLSQDEFTEEFCTAKPVSHEASSWSINIPDPSDMIPGIVYLPPEFQIVQSTADPRFREIESYNLNQLQKCKKKKRKRRRGSVVIPEKLEQQKECSVCLKNIVFTRDLVTLGCCDTTICTECMRTMISTKVNDGQTFIPCPYPDCTKALQRDQIVQHIDTEVLNKYERFRLNVEGDGSKKTCPNCCLITESDLPLFKSNEKTTLTPVEYNITCSECSFQWCYNCHSPWHEGLSCHSYREGDEQFMKWTKGRVAGYTPNCQKCPKCKVFIERSSGCDSMTCNRCHSNFCYKCGNHFRDFPGIGSHYKKLSVLGCPYNYQPNNPVKRKVIRGGYLFGKCAALFGFPILLVGVVAVVVVGLAVILPVVGGVMAYKVIQRKRRGY